MKKVSGNELWNEIHILHCFDLGSNIRFSKYVYVDDLKYSSCVSQRAIYYSLWCIQNDFKLWLSLCKNLCSFLFLMLFIVNYDILWIYNQNTFIFCHMRLNVIRNNSTLSFIVLRRKKWYFVTIIVLTYCEKKLF